MAAAAHAIAQGDVEQEADDETTDELGAMGGSFRAMITYLRDMAGAARKVADGDLSSAVQPRSENDVLGTSLSDMTVSLREIVGEVSSSAGVLSASSQQMAAASSEAGRVVGEFAARARRSTAPSTRWRPRARRSAGSSPPSPASPSRPTSSPSTRRSRPPGPGSRAAGSPSSPKRSASWPRSPSRRPGRSAR
jgi:methyl-accepting chemotaxis protein